MYFATVAVASVVEENFPVSLNPCTTIIIKPKIVNSNSSRESLGPTTSRTNRIRGSMHEDAIETACNFETLL
jgi:hypothetical protein